MGNSHPSIVPYQDFPTADGDMILAIGNDGQFERFCSVAGVSEWSVDKRFSTNPERVANRRMLIQMMRRVTTTRTTQEWISALEKAAVPCGPINRIDQVFDDEHVRARGMKLEVQHPALGPVPMVASPMNFSASPVQYHRAPPAPAVDSMKAKLEHRLIQFRCKEGV
jgi:crotonobetainyl-CoA:carnitine CoA-transferase CaiB-like acyl-CoA transferase